MSTTSSAMSMAPWSTWSRVDASSPSATPCRHMCAQFVGQVVESRTEGERTGEARGRWAPRRPARPGSTLRPSWGLDIGWELNGSEFINHHLFRWCEENSITFTRTRPYRKNDNCFVEQKNWPVVRQQVGYARFDDPDELEGCVRSTPTCACR